MAANRGRDLGHRRRAGSDDCAGDLCHRFARRTSQHVPDQSLRPVRAAAGVAVPVRPSLHGARIPNAVLISVRAAPALCGLDADVLGSAGDDGGPPFLRDIDDCVHAGRDPVRGSGPGEGTRREVRTVSARGADDHAEPWGSVPGEGGTTPRLRSLTLMQTEVRTLFGELSDLSRQERDRYYAEHSITEGLRRELESLLEFDTGTPIESVVHEAVGLVFQESIAEGEYCGPFQLLRQVGRGGMGVVYLAERVDGEVRQRVAVKLLRSSLDSSDAQQRFLQERQILASLAHPNIARMIDAGRRVDGRPYLAMEYVDGQPIDEHCRDLSTRKKVAIVATICDAIASAHQKLVVHRDLKPGNILVDSAGNPRVLDFGIAKLMDDSEETATVERRLTPEYASPEQIAGAAATTATDIYSLGAVLYKLLTDAPPIRRNPPAPSRSAGAGDRDLDAIVLKALRAEPGERYATADKFAEDLRAWLRHRPVAARQGERWYAARRQLRRYWLPVAAGTVATAGLVGGLMLARAERDLGRQRVGGVGQPAEEGVAVGKDIQGPPRPP